MSNTITMAENPNATEQHASPCGLFVKSGGRRSVGRRIADGDWPRGYVNPNDLPFLPVVRARTAAALGCLELAVERAVEETRREPDADEVARDAESLAGKISLSWYGHSLDRRCHCNCRVGDSLGVCTVLCDGSCDDYMYELVRDAGWRPGPEEVLGIEVGDGLCRRIPRLDVCRLLDASDREVAEELLDYGERDEGRVFGFAPREAFDDWVSSAVGELMEGRPGSVDIGRSYTLSLRVDEGRGKASVLDARGGTLASTCGIPMEVTVVRSVARAMAECPEVWPRSVTYAELYDASTRLLDTRYLYCPADVRGLDAYLSCMGVRLFLLPENWGEIEAKSFAEEACELLPAGLPAGVTLEEFDEDLDELDEGGMIEKYGESFTYWHFGIPR